MTITIGVWLIPTILNVLLIVWMIIAAGSSSGWFAGLFEFIFTIIGSLFIWLVYFAVLYFTLK
jgi:choline-glycine betaine transporter